MSNSLDPDQARRFVGPDLGPNCLPRLSADDTGRQRVKQEVQHNLLLLSCFAMCDLVHNVETMFSPLLLLRAPANGSFLGITYISEKISRGCLMSKHLYMRKQRRR